MTRRKIFVLHTIIALVCIAPLIALIGVATPERLEYTISCILSTEAISPAMILLAALMVYFVHKAHVA